MRQVRIASAIMLALGTLSLPAGAHEYSDTQRITIDHGSGTFYGRVRAEHAGCRRRVRVEVVESESGDVVARDRTNRRGRWRAAYEGAEDFYYAKVSPKTSGRLPHVHRCSGGVSDPVLVP